MIFRYIGETDKLIQCHIYEIKEVNRVLNMYDLTMLYGAGNEPKTDKTVKNVTINTTFGDDDYRMNDDDIRKMLCDKENGNDK